MAPLYASAASTAAANMHVEAAHHRLNWRKIFLILRDHVGVLDARAAVRTTGRHRHVLHVIDDGRRGAPALSTIRRPRLSAGPARRPMTGALREWRRLSIARPARRLQLPAQPLVFSAQSLALSLGAFEIASQSRVLVQHLLKRRPVTTRRSVGEIAHAPVMPESARPYKADPVTNYLPGWKRRRH